MTNFIDERPRIKLVVWDLDDTFWHGTLSEGGIRYNFRNHQLVIDLAERGILSSILSNNDHSTVQQELEARKIWDYFIFPSISWKPKAGRLQAMLMSSGFRPADTLFIDDDPRNLAEAIALHEDLQVLDPGSHFNRLSDVVAKTNVEGLSRLRTYQAIENRMTIAKDFGGISNIDFLEQSNITVSIDPDVITHAPRIIDLANRTNQLNFTKRPLAMSELLKMASKAGTELGAIAARDKYVDYGIIGFFCIQDKQLTHLFFSCRVLNLGIENWLYERLQFPQIDVVPPVAAKLNNAASVTWITERSEKRVSMQCSKPQRAKHLFIGGCDIEAITSFFDLDNSGRITTNYVNEAGVPTHTDHTELAVQFLQSNDRQTFTRNLEQLRIFDTLRFTDSTLEHQYDTVTISLAMDYWQSLYLLPKIKMRVPFGPFVHDATNKEASALSLGYNAIAVEMLAKLHPDWRFLGGLSPECISSNVLFLRRHFSAATSFVIINGLSTQAHGEAPEISQRNGAINKQILEVLSINTDIKLLDVDAFVSVETDVTDSSRHFTRRTYRVLAEALADIHGNYSDWLST